VLGEVTLSLEQWYDIAVAPNQRDESLVMWNEKMPIRQCMEATAHEMIAKAQKRVQLLGTQKVVLKSLDRLQKQLV
jgi:hypothetical protein